jgi:hypothetical protein
MAHFAKLGTDNIVITVHVVSNDIATTEQAGIDFLNKLFKTNDVWKQTSYNTRAGVHQLGGTPFRKNYAGKGFHYNQELDAFLPLKEFPSWILNEETYQWDAPIAKPVTHTQNLTEDNKSIPDVYNWNEQKVKWELKLKDK